MPDDATLCDDFSEPIRDVEEAVCALSTVGINARFDRLEDRSDFSLVMKVHSFGAAELVVTKWGTSNWLGAEVPGRMAAIINPTGDMPSVFSTSGDDVPALTGQIVPVIQSGREIKVFRPVNAPLFVLSAELKELERHFRGIVGSDRVPLDFEPALNLKSPEGERFQRLVKYAVGELKAEPSALQNPIYRRQFDDLILGALLSLRGMHHRLIDLANHSTGSAVVRRAEEFMEANVGRPIGMSDVAKECGCSRTVLYQAFKREREWTPLQFLVRRRMEHARRRLLAPSEGVNVTMVSLDCGYANFSRFSEVYRERYGEPPSKTLNRSR